jgi:single-stranded-DNA-specific exonuclease
LRARGFGDPAAARAFLHPSRDQLGDPFLMPGMDAAVERLQSARASGRPVVVYGDYDVDGVTATALLTGFLARWGIEAHAYIPSRHREGYGLNGEAVRKIASEHAGAMMVTVDCGVSALAEIDLAVELGLNPVVTDHHRPGEALPDCPVLNPLLGYPCPHLCGAGVAFKLCQALDLDLAFSFIDLAALGTVADVVPLTNENRAITALGIARINDSPRPGLQALMKEAGVKEGQITSGKIGFQLAPRLNAGGRVGDAVRSLKLLAAKSLEEAEPLAKELEEANLTRKALEGEILTGAEEQLKDFDFAARRSIVLADQKWNVGVLGLAASRLVERYNLPVVLMREEDGMLHGSCRSIPGVDIFKMLTEVSPLLVRFGGHSQAAGLTLSAERLAEFSRALDEVIVQSADPECFVPAARYDMALPLSELDEGFMRSLPLFEPTGFGNPAPVFLAEAAITSREAVGGDKTHLRMRLTDGGSSLPGIAFSMGDRARNLPDRVRMLYVPEINRYNGREYPQCQVRAISEAGYPDAFLAGKPDFDGLFQSFLTNRLYNKAYSVESAGAFDGFEEIFARLCDCPRGALILAASPENAAAFLEAAQREAPGRMDVFAGKFPPDRRAFNAFCLLPLGAPPSGYERVYSLDAPCAFWGYPALEPARPAPLELLFPDVDSLRAVYVAAWDRMKRPDAAASLRSVVKDLACEAGVTAGFAFAALKVLHDMDLIALGEASPFLRPRPRRKADPMENPVFRWMRRLSRWGGEPLDAG